MSCGLPHSHWHISHGVLFLHQCLTLMLRLCRSLAVCCVLFSDWPRLQHDIVPDEVGPTVHWSRSVLLNRMLPWLPGRYHPRHCPRHWLFLHYLYTACTLENALQCSYTACTPQPAVAKHLGSMGVKSPRFAQSSASLQTVKHISM